MKDNKPIEKQAENYLKSQLSKFEFNYQEPSYDKNGSDLTLIENLKAKKTRLLNIQSKGRTITKQSTNVKIPKEYVNERFILFIYTVDEYKTENLFIFFPNEIVKWTLNTKNEYTLSFNIAKTKESYFTDKVFNSSKSQELRTVLTRSEIKNYTTILIDGIFLEKAIKCTINTYSKIWPGKDFIKPDIKTVVKNILDSYDRFKTKSKTINCLLITSEHFSLEEHINFDCKLNFKTQKDNLVNIFVTKSGEIVSFDILEQMERLINNDNIILVADDVTYENKLKEYKDVGVEVIVVQFNEAQERKIYSDFKWGDVMYPLGFSIGLEKWEI
ncbi:hypothetical protein [Maribacter sp. 4G9]|uniref:hypothetical protein n=1 Tax=Maribacter sp. 4G9 TaxID=1889777 RepID=UPI000C150475|nr:hypothetical protein [Maribacter sp. 4G9]PIB30594.1 hypothetical protein BFP75_02340 [Maribacter sp. 4G9]